MKTLDDAPYLDIFSEAFLADAASVVDGVRQQSWLARTPIGAIALGRAQVQALLSDRRLRSAVPDLARLQGVGESELGHQLTTSIIALEGEDHTRIRKLVSRAFTPRAVDVHRPKMRETLHTLVDPLAGQGRCDFVSAIADHYPIEVMCHLLGVPPEDHEDFARWNRAITWALSFSLFEHVADVEWGLEHLGEYIDRLTTERRREPREDLVTALLQATEADDRLTDEEVFSLIAALLFAGYDTTRNQLGLAMALFCEYPAQWEALRTDPSLAPQAVEEIMRFQGAVAAVPRMVLEDIEMDGFRIPEGTLLTLSSTSANHDPDTYDDPWTFDITVEREPHFTFGGGPHYCLGASLARAEMQEALPILAEAMPGLALDGEPEWRPPFGIFGPDSLPIRWSVPRK
jgi:cytochrome P450